MYQTLENLTENEQKLLVKFRESVSDLLQPEHDDIYLVKWLKAYYFNKENAEANMRKSSAGFRKEYGIDTIRKDFVVPEVIKKHGIDGSLGFDKEGSPVRLILLNKSDVKGLLNSLAEENIIKYIFYALEEDNAMRLENNKKNGLWAEKNVYIIELDGFPLSDVFSKSILDLAMKIAQLYISNYPENMKTIAIINAPAFTHWVYSMIKPILPPELVPKIKIFGSDGWKDFLLDTVGPETLPAYMGGKLSDPDGNPMCLTLVRQGGEIPKEYYLHYRKRLQPDDPDVHSAIVDIKSSLVVEIPVDDSNAVLFWEYQTEKFDIGCGLSYKKDTETDDKELKVLVPIRRKKCDEVPSDGMFVCEIPGIYVLHFDNSYSWVVQKKLLYKVEVLLPNDIIKTYELEDEIE